MPSPSSQEQIGRSCNFIHVCSQSYSKDGTESHGPRLCCARRSLQSYDELSRLFGTQTVICGYIQAQPQQYLQIWLKLIYSILAGEGNVSAALHKELEQKTVLFLLHDKKTASGAQSKF